MVQTTMYRGELLRLPAPPLMEEFNRRHDGHEEAFKEWYQLVDDNFGVGNE